GADALRSAAADVPVDPRGKDRLVLVALVKLVLDARGEIVESALRVAAVRLYLLVRRTESDAEIFGDPFRDIDRKVRLAHGGLTGHFLIEDRRQRKLVRDERIVGHERRR